MPAKLNATKLKLIIRSLPGKVLLECNQAGNLDLHLEKEGNYIFIGHIDFKTERILLQRCPTCGLDLELTGTKGKLHCPLCKNTFQE